MAEAVHQQYGFSALLALPKATRTEDLARTSAPRIFLDLPRPERSFRLDFQFRTGVRVLLAARQLARLIRERDISILHANELLDLYAPLGARITRRPYVCHVRTNLSILPKAARNVIVGIQKWGSDGMIMVSNALARDLIDGSFGRAENIRVIYDPGPDPSKFTPKSDAEAAMVRLELDIPAGAPIVTLVAKLSRFKGHESLLQAAPFVVGQFPQARFLIVGGELPGDGHAAYAERLLRLPGQLGVSNEVRFLGFRDDVERILAASDVVVHCSNIFDSFPGVVLEGMAMAKPVVATAMGGTVEQIEDGVSGILVPPDDPGELGNAICRLLGNPALRRKMGAAAAQRIHALTANDRFAREIVDFYTEVLARREGRS